KFLRCELMSSWILKKVKHLTERQRPRANVCYKHTRLLMNTTNKLLNRRPAWRAGNFCRINASLQITRSIMVSDMRHLGGVICFSYCIHSDFACQHYTDRL